MSGSARPPLPAPGCTSADLQQFAARQVRFHAGWGHRCPTSALATARQGPHAPPAPATALCLCRWGLEPAAGQRSGRPPLPAAAATVAQRVPAGTALVGAGVPRLPRSTHPCQLRQQSPRSRVTRPGAGLADGRCLHLRGSAAQHPRASHQLSKTGGPAGAAALRAPGRGPPL